MSAPRSGTAIAYATSWPYDWPTVSRSGCDRERDVLTLVGRGLSNDEICHQLHISMPTTKTHIGRLLAKLAARDRAQLVIAAYENGLIA
jgi:DNA-binding NarL/FixJ family response regulator